MRSFFSFVMKTHPKTSSPAGRSETKNLTLGDLVASTYAACGDRAPKLLQLALESQLVRLKHGFWH
jgi:hypothetical protein